MDVSYYFMKLEETLNNPFFSKDREELLNYRLFYHLKLEGLKNGYDFELLEPVIDKNGYDLLLKYHNYTKAFQIKSKSKTGAKGWKINKNFLRPSILQEGEKIISDFKAEFCGLSGGIILLDFKSNNDVKINLSIEYFDVGCLVKYLKGELNWKINKRSYKNFVKELFDDSSNLIYIPKSLFIKLKNINELLDLSRVYPIEKTPNLNNRQTWISIFQNLQLESDTEQIKIITPTHGYEYDIGIYLPPSRPHLAKRNEDV